MILDPRAVALQGIGFGAFPAALQGFYELEQEVAGVGPDERRIAPAQRQSNIARLMAEDEILLAVLVRAVTTGALDQWRRSN